MRLGPVFCVCLVGLLSIATVTDASCSLVHTIMLCTGELPNLDKVTAQVPALDVILNNYDGHLSTSRDEGPHDVYASSITIKSGSIQSIQPGFFLRLGGDRLKHLSMNEVGGSYQLDARTLQGLGNSLLTLRVAKHHLTDISGLASLRKLTDLTLFQTNLSTLPPNFGEVIQTVSRVDLSHNQLTSLPWKVIAERIKSQQLISITLKFNPLHCDCSLTPVLNSELLARKKIIGFKCASPPDFADRTLDMLSSKLVCPDGPDVDDGQTENPKTTEKNKVQPSADRNERPASKSEPAIAAAGSMSTEMIIAVVAVALIILVIVCAVIAYAIRRRGRGSREEGTKKRAEHKSNAFFAIIESPEEQHRNEGGNAQSRELDQTERQPLNPPYKKQTDHRL